MEEVSPIEVLDKIKRSEGIEDEVQDNNIMDIIEDTISHFKMLTGASKVEQDFEFIIKEVSLVRYNRKGSYGFKSHSVGDQSISYQDPKDDFLPYESILNKRFGTGGPRRGVVYFY